MKRRRERPARWHFFSRMLCGFTLGDHIRMRRLAFAAEDLMRSDDKVTDIAYLYGYDTPESYSRAFTRFHGVTPTQARHGGSVKFFSRSPLN